MLFATSSALLPSTIVLALQTIPFVLHWEAAMLMQLALMIEVVILAVVMQDTQEMGLLVQVMALHMLRGGRTVLNLLYCFVFPYDVTQGRRTTFFDKKLSNTL